MRVGDGDEFEVGTIEFDLVAGTTQPDMPGVRPRLAAMLRAAADAIEEEGDSPT
jgi:hypothetical protein